MKPEQHRPKAETSDPIRASDCRNERRSECRKSSTDKEKPILETENSNKLEPGWPLHLENKDGSKSAQSRTSGDGPMQLIPNNETAGSGCAIECNRGDNPGCARSNVRTKDSKQVRLNNGSRNPGHPELCIKGPTVPRCKRSRN